MEKFCNSASPSPIIQKAFQFSRLKPFVFIDLQREIHTEKFSCVKLNYAVFTH